MEGIEKNTLEINIQNYSGPLEVLLDLAKLQKVDLAKISITQLADQFLEFIKKAKKINLDLALDYLVMATWLAYLKSKLLLPEIEDDDFKPFEVAEKLKLQLKKLELIRLLSDQLLKKNRIGVDIFLRGKPEGIRSIHSLNYHASLYDVLKSYSNFKMKQNFLRMNIPKLPVYTTEEGIKRIKNNYNILRGWKNILHLIPEDFIKSKNLKRTGLAGIFTASLELVREGNLEIMQKKLFGEMLIKRK